ncbi:MAG: PilZ domain-containing protein [Myxococcaceae bacterium]
MPRRIEPKPTVVTRPEPRHPPRPKVAGMPPLEPDFDGPEHRKFPRARMAVPFSLWIGDGEDRRFSAKLTSINISVSGALLESTFFLPQDTELRLSFKIEDEEEPVQARAQIIREERPDAQGRGRSAFALRFVEFYAQTEVTLAKLFLGEQLREFAEGYLGSKRARSLTNELDRVVDALAAWELKKVTTPEMAGGLRQGS